MNKVKEYINNKPKLKKTLKILAVIGVIFSVSFNILIIGVASCSNSKVADAIDEPLVTTPVSKGAINVGNGYYDVGFGELGGDVFVTKFIENLKGYDYVWWSNTTTENFLLGTPVTLDLNNYYDAQAGDYGDGTFTRYMYVEKVYLHYDASLDYQTIFTIGFYYGGGWRYIKTSMQYIDIYKTQNISNLQTYLGSTPYFFESTCIRFYVTDWQTLIPFEAFDINNYNLGYENGYNYGYSKGYNEGIRSYNTDVFTLIGNAFSAVDGILSIQVLPHLQLWVLIFAPIIVSVIIVVVKMIKG